MVDMNDLNIEDILNEVGLNTSENSISDTSTTTALTILTEAIEPPTVLEPPTLTVEEEETEEDVDSLVEEVQDNQSGQIVNIAETDTLEDILASVEVSPVETPAKPISVEEALACITQKTLPVNPNIFNTNDTTSRFSGAAWYEAVQQSTILLAGVGGIGSFTLFCLSRMKPAKIYIYDDDVVELANLSGQLYSLNMVGKNKVNAMSTLAKDFSNYYSVVAIPQRFTVDTPTSDIMICGFDNMGARHSFFNAWVAHVSKQEHPEKCLFIDGRLSMEEFQVFCFQGDDVYSIDRYRKEQLFNDYQAVSEPCSAKQTTYCSNMIGSVITNLFTNFIANTLNPVIPRELPYKTYYNAGFMYLKTEM